MIHKFILISFLFLFSYVSAQVPIIEWQHNYGGLNDDEGYSICKLQNGSFLIVGITNSTNGYVTQNHGSSDVWLIKIDSIGSLIWNKCYGSGSDEEGYSICQTSDNGFIFTGYATLNGGDVSGAHFGGSDFWIVKTDSNGILLWQKCLGGTGDDEAKKIIQTKDSGYLVVGSTMSPDFDVHGWHGGDDMWVVKLDQTGNIQWSKALGGSDFDQANACLQKQNGNYLIAGDASSIDGDVTGNHNNSSDVWVVELDTSGNIVWQKCFGGSDLDNSYDLLPSENNGCYVVGYTKSNDGDINLHYGQEDFWLIKVDSIGNLIWNKCFGGIYSEFAYKACLSSDGGILITGFSSFDDGMVSGNHGGSFPWFPDFWVIKVDTFGNFLWGKCLGGTADDIAYDIKETTDGGIIVAGTTASNDGDLLFNYTGPHGGAGTNGGKDVWVVKLSSPTSGIPTLETQLMDFSATQINDQLSLRFFAQKSAATQLKLYDLNRRLLFEKPLRVNEGINYSLVPCAGLAKGMYVMEITGRNVEQRVRVVVER